MRIWILTIGMVVLLPTVGATEVWEFSCTEAVSLLKAAQDRVVQKHDQLQEAKFSLRHSPRKFDGCRRNRGGYDGGNIYCVKHESRSRHLHRDILIAQQSLDSAHRDFDRQVQGVLRSCPIAQP